MVKSASKEGGKALKFCEKLIALRRRENLTQEELAERIGVTRAVIYCWEKGMILPSADNLIILSDVFSLSADVLIKENMEIPDRLSEPENADFIAESATLEAASDVENVLPKKSHRPRAGVYLGAVAVILLVILILICAVDTYFARRLPLSTGQYVFEWEKYVNIQLNRLIFLIPIWFIAAIPLYILTVYIIIWAILSLRARIEALRDDNKNDENNNNE